ncbi:MAG: hypothetical protein PHD45_10085 [Bacteroidales bacterium]|nr:hypothetical protein [Bacteroidales bacterium]
MHFLFAISHHSPTTIPLTPSQNLRLEIQNLSSHFTNPPPFQNQSATFSPSKRHFTTLKTPF